MWRDEGGGTRREERRKEMMRTYEEGKRWVNEGNGIKMGNGVRRQERGKKADKR